MRSLLCIVLYTLPQPSRLPTAHTLHNIAPQKQKKCVTGV
jgi:hypothetical protein